MADEQPITEQIFEPSPARVLAGPPTTYPWLFTFRGEDSVELSSWNYAAGVRLVVQGRVSGADGEIKPFSASHTPNTDRTIRTTYHTVPAGELLNLIVFAEAGSPLLGQTIVRLAVVRGIAPAITRIGVLVGGPVTSSFARAFPGSEVVSSLDGEPAVRTIQSATPGAGLEFRETVPTGARWQILMIQASFQAAAGGVARRPQIVWSQAGSQVGISANVADVAASQQGVFNWLQGMPLAAAVYAGSNVAGLPNQMLMLAGDYVSSFTANIAAADQWSLVRLTVREWLDI